MSTAALALSAVQPRRAGNSGREWTPDRLNRVRKLHGLGKSASLIAMELSVSRAAVLGAVKRARDQGESGWTRLGDDAVERLDGKVLNRPAKCREPKKKSPPPKALPTPAAPQLPLFQAAWNLPESRRVPLLELSAAECKFFDDSGPGCCGAPTRKGKNYCAGHHAIVYRSPA